MSLFIPTGEQQTFPCECGTVVEQQEGWITGTTMELHWRKSNHDAPCGLPCLAGGVKPQAYRDGIFHRTGGRCPRCAPEVENPRETIGPRKLAERIRTDDPSE